jgi:hypothetical protein
VWSKGLCGNDNSKLHQYEVMVALCRVLLRVTAGKGTTMMMEMKEADDVPVDSESDEDASEEVVALRARRRRRRHKRRRKRAKRGKTSDRVLILRARMQQLLTLWQKCAATRRLYAGSDPLCAHEVPALEWAANSLGNVLPLTHPTATLPFKLHSVTHRMPAFAKQHGTVGMYAEHAIEHAHVEMNHLDRTNARMGSNKRKMELMAARFALLHDQVAPSFQRPQRNLTRLGENKRRRQTI